MDTQTQQYTQQERGLAAACYIPYFSAIICLVALIKKGANPFMAYHIRNALVLFCVWFLSIFIVMIIVIILPILGGFFSLILLAINIYCGVLAWKGTMKFVPVITPLGKIIPLEKLYTALTGKAYGAQTASSPSAQAQGQPEAQKPEAQKPAEQKPEAQKPEPPQTPANPQSN